MIEFVGLSGSGKSTIRRELIKRDGLLGWENGCFFWRTPINNFTYLNNIIRNIHLNFIKNNMSKVEMFERNNKDTVEVIAKYISKSDHEYVKLYNLFLDSLKKYIYTRELADDNSIVCMDEFLFQRSVSLAFRSENFDIPNNDYFNNIIKPEMIVFLETPPNVCIERRKDRGDQLELPDWLESYSFLEVEERMYHHLDRVIDIAEKQDVNIVTVDNIGGIDRSVDYVWEQITFHYDQI